MKCWSRGIREALIQKRPFFKRGPYSKEALIQKRPLFKASSRMKCWSRGIRAR